MVKKIALITFLALFIVPAVSAQGVRNLPPQAKTPQQTMMMGDENSDMKARVQAFRAKVAEISDTQKKTIVERIANKIATANTRLTSAMSSALDKLTAIIERLKTKAELAAGSGQDATALLSSIVAAEEAIEAAKTQITEQATKEYAADITDELTLRNTIGAMVSEFRTDISAVHQAVIDAKQAVREAVNEAKALEGVSPTATDSATINELN